MSQTLLSKAISRGKGPSGLLEIATSASLGTWCVLDAEQRLVYGHLPDNGTHTAPIHHAGEVVGWVKGDQSSAGLIAAMLQTWLQQESEKKQLGAETLHLYREINLIFSFSEKLSKTISTDAIAQLTLEEARQIIPFTEGAVLLWREKTPRCHVLATLGGAFLIADDDAFFDHIVQNGQSEIATDPADVSRMVLYASLKLGERVLGCIALRGEFFTASGLKLLSALAAQTAASLENAARHEQHIADALKAQREQLMLELAMKNPFFKKIMAVIEAKHRNPDFSPAQLAQSQHLSLSQLQRKIAALTDLTAVQIIRDCRLTHARRLLKDTTLSISEVAFESGFQDPSYFTRLFTRELGSTPSEWRDNTRGMN